MSALEQPAGAGSAGIAVVCHPHPQHGGTMHNKVVHTLARALQEQGRTTLRFNYRGVGGSAGSYDGGVGETDDARAAIAWLRARWPDAPLTLAGALIAAALGGASASTCVDWTGSSPQSGFLPQLPHRRGSALPVQRLGGRRLQRHHLRADLD